MRGGGSVGLGIDLEPKRGRQKVLRSFYFVCSINIQTFQQYTFPFNFNQKGHTSIPLVSRPIRPGDRCDKQNRECGGYNVTVCREAHCHVVLELFLGALCTFVKRKCSAFLKFALSNLKNFKVGNS